MNFSSSIGGIYEKKTAVEERQWAIEQYIKGRSPAREKPVMYICNPDMCSIPIEDPALVAAQAAAFRGPAGS